MRRCGHLPGLLQTPGGLSSALSASRWPDFWARAQSQALVSRRLRAAWVSHRSTEAFRSLRTQCATPFEHRGSSQSWGSSQSQECQHPGPGFQKVLGPAPNNWSRLQSDQPSFEPAACPASVRVICRSQIPGEAGRVLCSAACKCRGLWGLGPGLTQQAHLPPPAAGFCPKAHKSVTAFHTEDFPLGLFSASLSL